MSKGSFKIWPADKAGNPLGHPTPPEGKPAEPPNPLDEAAVDIYFGVPASVPQPPPKDQFELQQEIAKVLRTVQLLYGPPIGDPNGRCKPQFRSYYARLFRLAQLGLEGDQVSPEIARGALSAVADNLIEDEASRVKNDHLKLLGKTALFLSGPFVLVYFVLGFTPPDSCPAKVLLSVGVERGVLASFMILWVGCFLGVWLSYGIRTSVPTLADLTVTDVDRLLPAIRLLFAGSLTMILGIMFMLGIIRISLGTYSITEFATNPTLAFLIGCLCGISELLLPASVAKRANDFIGKGKQS